MAVATGFMASGSRACQIRYGVPIHSMQFVFSSCEACHCRAGALGLLYDDCEAQPMAAGGVEGGQLQRCHRTVRVLLLPCVIVFVFVQAWILVAAVVNVACSSSHGAEKFVPQDSAVLVGIPVLD